MSSARRGEIWRVDFGVPMGNEQGPTGPRGLIRSLERARLHRDGAPDDRTRDGFPTRVEIEPDAVNGLDAVSYARCEDIRTVSGRRLVHPLGRVDAVVLANVARTLRIFLES